MNIAQSGPSYTAETYCVVGTEETGWCVKHGDDLVCDVYAHKGEEMARRIATLLNTSPAGARDAVRDAVRRAELLLPVLRNSAESWGNHHCAGELRRAIELVEFLLPLTGKADGETK